MYSRSAQAKIGGWFCKKKLMEWMLKWKFNFSISMNLITFNYTTFFFFDR